MDQETFIYQDSAPYPPIEVCGPNLVYAAEMLSNIGSCNSEMSAVSLYFYNSLISKEPYAQIAECFQHIMIVEMHHLDIYGQLAYRLGADPRLWSYSGRRASYWSPGCNQYPCQLEPLLRNAIKGENEAIMKYRRQAERIKDENIAAILNRIILDEKCHIHIFDRLYRTYVLDRGGQES